LHKLEQHVVVSPANGFLGLLYERDIVDSQTLQLTPTTKTGAVFCKRILRQSTTCVNFSAPAGAPVLNILGLHVWEVVTGAKIQQHPSCSQTSRCERKLSTRYVQVRLCALPPCTWATSGLQKVCNWATSLSSSHTHR
jgi:hypothetical protein